MMHQAMRQTAPSTIGWSEFSERMELTRRRAEGVVHITAVLERQEQHCQVIADLCKTVVVMNLGFTQLTH
eukprot:811991-Amphidinium_carterae.1